MWADIEKESQLKFLHGASHCYSCGHISSILSAGKYTLAAVKICAPEHNYCGSKYFCSNNFTLAAAKLVAGLHRHNKFCSDKTEEKRGKKRRKKKNPTAMSLILFSAANVPPISLLQLQT